MAWGIISDIHANLQALEAVLEAMGEVEGILCLGDVVGYGADPVECCRVVRQLAPLVLLKGNHEAGVLEELPLSWFSRHALLALIWTRSNLPPEWTDFLSTFTLRASLSKDVTATQSGADDAPAPESPAGILLVHGSLDEPYDYLDSSWKANQLLAQTEAKLSFFGHTHFAGWFESREEAAGRPTAPKSKRRRRFGDITEVLGGDNACRWTPCPEGGLLRLEKSVRYVINCGSVGQPRDGNPEAAFGLFNPVQRAVEFRRVGYDVEGAQERIRRAGLPDVLAERLTYGL
jgi:diadenosine tetraphosphatase ApaH/serine/threonine PP2A family protein phosphatase